jgi:hypothetical protein
VGNVYCSRSIKEWGEACINLTLVLIMDAQSMEEWGGIMYTAREAWRMGWRIRQWILIMDAQSMEEWGGVMYTACEAWRNGWHI